MISVNQTYTDLIEAGAAYEWRITNGSNTYTVSNLMTASLTTTLMDGLSVGNCLAAQLRLSMWNTSPDTTNPLVLQFRANDGNGNTSDWYTKGRYYIDTVDSSPYSEITEVVAFDSMLKANVPLVLSGEWTATTDYDLITNVNHGIAQAMGVTVDSATASALQSSPITLSVAPNLGADGTTEREMLSYIAAMRGGNWIINSGNKLELIYPYATPTNTARVYNSVDEFDTAPPETVRRVRVWLNSGTYFLAPEQATEDAWEALGGYCLEVDIPFYGTQAIAESRNTLYHGKTFYPYTAQRAFVDPKYELGDGISFLTSSPVTSLIVNQTINVGWLAESNFEFRGEDIASSSYPTRTAERREIDRNTEAIASIRIEQGEIVSTVQDSVSNLQTQITQTASGVEAVSERLDGQESYIRWDGSTSTVSIGASDAPTEAQISPDGFAVVQNGDAILEAKGHHVVTEHFEATSTVTIGKYQWVDEDSNGYSLIYIGQAV